MIRNRKGYATISVAIGVLLSTAVIIANAYYPIVNLAFSIKKSDKDIDKYIESRTGIERVYSILYKNISYNEDIIYSDINKTYRVKENVVNYKDIETKLSGEGTESFEIINKTHITIDIDFEEDEEPIQEEGVEQLPEEPSYYTVNVLYGGKSIIGGVRTFSTGKSIEIPETILYDETRGEHNYGEYTLIIRETNGTARYNIKYKEQTYREIELIENETLKRTIILENNKSNGEETKLYIKTR